jgi:hypothetical protein
MKTELLRCNRISPKLLCLLTHQVRMASKSTKAAENVYAPLVMVSLGWCKVNDTCRQENTSNNGSIDTNFDPLQFPLDSTFKQRKSPYLA